MKITSTSSCHFMIAKKNSFYKVYSEWPTIPQLYVAGEFVGGCDIITTMYKDGELEKLLKEKKLISD